MNTSTGNVRMNKFHAGLDGGKLIAYAAQYDMMISTTSSSTSKMRRL